MNAALRDFRAELRRRLCRGERVVLYGPRAAGKTRLVGELQAELIRAGIPCGRSPATAHLDDITRALMCAYPQVNAAAVKRRTARSRLWLAADQRGGVLLLDHVTDVSNAMVSFMRRLTGGIAGILWVLDVDVERERTLVRPGRLGGIPAQMPLMSQADLRRLWRVRWAGLHLDLVDEAVERQLLRAAHGRPGWIICCAELAAQPRYWREHRLALATLLCTDAEIVVREGNTAALPFEELSQRATSH